MDSVRIRKRSQRSMNHSMTIVYYLQVDVIVTMASTEIMSKPKHSGIVVYEINLELPRFQ